MRPLSCALLALGLGALPAQAEEVRFQGTIVTTAVEKCEFTTVGTLAVARFRPPGIAANGSSGLSMTFDGSAYAIAFGNALPRLNQFTKVESVITGDYGFATYSNRIKITKLEPREIDRATKSVYLEAVVEEPFGENFSPGKCVVAIRAALVRLPD